MSLDHRHLRAHLRKWARTFHIYLSLLGLFLMLFFAVTGFMLNHGKWFNFGKTQNRTYSATLPLPIVQAQKEPPIVQWLRSNAGVTGSRDSFSVKGTDILLNFSSPSREFEIKIAGATGKAQITCKTFSLAFRMVLLHVGGNTGPVWGYVIDATAILLTISIFTGTILWLTVPKWRNYGIAAISVCLLGCGLIYFLTVP